MQRPVWVKKRERESEETRRDGSFVGEVVDADRVPRLVLSVKEMGILALKPEAEALLRYVDGAKTVRDIAGLAHVAPSIATAVFARLVGRGIITLR